MTSQALSVRNNQSAGIPDSVGPLLASSESLFWQASYLVGSAATDILPFVFWITENAAPRLLVSLEPAPAEAYFAICQTIERLGIGTRALNITAASPDSGMQRCNAGAYDDFSTLLHEEPGAASRNFDDHSVDLLYVDLAHPPKDLSLWQDKLSPRGVVILRGVSDLSLKGARKTSMSQLGCDSADFTLECGGGVAVILGPQAREPIKKLCNMEIGMAGYAETHRLFHRLGKAQRDAFRARDEVAQRRALETQIAEAQQQAETATQALDAMHAKQTALQRAHDARLQQIEVLEATLDSERDALKDSSGLCETLGAQLRLAQTEMAQHRTLLNEEETANLENKNTWLRGELAKHKTRASELEQSVKAATETQQKSDDEIQTLKDQLEERTTEMDAQVQLFEAEKAQAAKDAKAQAEQVQSEISRQMDAAEQTRKTADAEINALNDKLEERTTDLVTLTQLFEAEKAQNARTLADRQEWQDIRIELRDAEIAMLRGAGSRLRRGDSPSRAGLPSQKKQLEILRGSKLFDPDWYLKTYPDVAKSQADPATHYMMHGALDGRNPGPDFDTMAYYRANRDVARLGFNALVHYEMFGRDEKRKLRKDG